jgi:hypothetical protein
MARRLDWRLEARTELDEIDWLIANPMAVLKLNFKAVVAALLGTVVVALLGTVVAALLGTVVVGIAGTVGFLRQMRPFVALKETGALHGPQPFLFLARAETLYLFEARPFNLQFFARPTTVQVNVPTFTCVERIGDARCVVGKLNVTAISIFPERTFAEMTVSDGFVGFADTEIASAAVPETPDRISKTKITRENLHLNLVISNSPKNLVYQYKQSDSN